MPFDRRQHDARYYRKHRIAILRYQKQYYRAHRTEIYAKKRALIAQDPQATSLYMRAYRRKHRGKMMEYKHAYHIRHRRRLLAEMSARQKRRRATDPQFPLLRAAYAAKRNAIKRNAAGHYSAADIARLYAEQDGKCRCCRVALGQRFHVDHIKSLARGGSNWLANLQLLCPPCNHSKSDRLTAACPRHHNLT